VRSDTCIKWEGIGLRLSFAKGIRRELLHGKRIWVTSEAGKGSTFSFIKAISLNPAVIFATGSLCHNFARTICSNVFESVNRASVDRLQTLGFIHLATDRDT
jgi:hypothetical protein